MRQRITQASPIRPLLPPDLAAVYNARVAELKRAVADGTSPDVLEAARALIHKDVLHPNDDPEGEPIIKREG